MRENICVAARDRKRHICEVMRYWCVERLGETGLEALMAVVACGCDFAPRA